MLIHVVAFGCWLLNEHENVFNNNNNTEQKRTKNRILLGLGKQKLAQNARLRSRRKMANGLHVQLKVVS